MFAAALREQFVSRAARRDCLQQFLEMTFGIDVDRLHFQSRQIVRGQRQNKPARRRQIGVEVDCAEERFEGVGQRRGPHPSAASFFAASHHEILAEIEFERVPAQSFTGDEPRAQLRQSPFGFAREKREEMLGHDELHDGIAEVLEPLIIEMMPVRLVPETGVGQSLCQQQRVAEFVTDPFLEWIHAMFKLFRHGGNFSRNSAGEASSPLVD